MALKKAPAGKSAAKSPKAAPAKSGAQSTVTLKHLAAALSESHEVPKKQADAMLNDMVGLVKNPASLQVLPHTAPDNSDDPVQSYLKQMEYLQMHVGKREHPDDDAEAE